MSSSPVQYWTWKQIISLALTAFFHVNFALAAESVITASTITQARVEQMKASNNNKISASCVRISFMHTIKAHVNLTFIYASSHPTSAPSLKLDWGQSSQPPNRQHTKAQHHHTGQLKLKYWIHGASYLQSQPLKCPEQSAFLTRFENSISNVHSRSEVEVTHHGQEQHRFKMAFRLTWPL